MRYEARGTRYKAREIVILAQLESRTKLQDIEGLVADYLQRHPDFFLRYPDLLLDLEIPHVPGPNVASLVERQVSQLRRKIQRLQHELDEREVRTARERVLMEGLQRTLTRLLVMPDPVRGYQLLAKFLKSDFAADELRVFVFRDDAELQAVTGLKFMARNAKLKYLFIELLNRNKPLCGSLQEEHVRLLFQAAAGHVSSTILIPLRLSDAEVLVAIGSQERNCYGRGFELELLQFLFAMFGTWLEKVLNRPTA